MYRRAGDASDAARLSPGDAARRYGRARVFRASRLAGRSRADVDLFLPFKEFDRRRVLVHAHLTGRVAESKGSTLVRHRPERRCRYRRRAGGARRFSRPSCWAAPFRCRHARRATVPVTRTQLVFDGTFERRGAACGAVAAADRLPISGSTDWHAVLAWRRSPRANARCASHAIWSGSTSNLPEPLAKPAGTPMPAVGRCSVARRAARRRCAWLWARVLRGQLTWRRVPTARGRPRGHRLRRGGEPAPSAIPSA